MKAHETQHDATGLEIAVIGMAGRFPGAADILEFWDNLCNGVESVVEYDEASLRAMGVPQALLDDPDYVRAGIPFEHMDKFDAALFGYTPRDAQLLDPQHRLFLESAWHALEHAGYINGAQADAPVGIYAGCGASVYLIRHLLGQAPLTESTTVADVLSLMSGNGADSLATRLAYKLDLKGPAVAVQTACSTSLAAVHMACQSLLGQECDMALAGGVSLNLLQQGGYLYRNGAIFSRDGHCRAFDANASGTLLGSGAGVVVLKRLEDAVSDGDTIHAVIKGTAANNDGADKVGFTAPSVRGQAQVIRAAQALAEVDPASIGYVEAHGTGTVLGDPIEIAALTQAFGLQGGSRQCAIGSVKTNIGHLDAAAGVAGLIKTVMALKNRTLPASLNFDAPNPQIDFAGSPFYVNTRTQPWPEGPVPRRAGVSAFGIGGTNVHVVLEEYVSPDAQVEDAYGEGERPFGYALPLSARTEASLRAGVENLRHYLETQSTGSLEPVSSTLAIGRRHLGQRCMVLASSVAHAVEVLGQQPPAAFFQGRVVAEAPAVAFMFPGQGAQHVNMGRSLYESEAAFRAIVDDCCQVLKADLGLDLRQLLFPTPAEQERAAALLTQTQYTQPALFVMEYALARLWMSWGIAPDAMIGHSIGEYAAACLAGVFSLPDALRLVALRGKLLQGMAPGAMLAVGLSEPALRQAMPPGCDIAAINAPDLCVLSGTQASIDGAEARFRQQDVTVSRLHVSHAFHSAMVDPMLAAFSSALAGVRLSMPTIPFISNLSGTWIRPDEATDPAYWVRHVRGTVRFADGVAQLLKKEGRVLLEVGPGQVLSRLARNHPQAGQAPVLASQSHPRQLAGNAMQAYRCLAQLWVAGVDIGASPLFRFRRVRRIPLPLYVFDRQSYWVDAPSGDGASRANPADAAMRVSDRDAYLYVPAWKRQALLPAAPRPCAAEQRVLLLGSETPFIRALRATLRKKGHGVVSVAMADRYRQVAADSFEVRPGEEQDFSRLMRGLAEQGGAVAHICHAWGLDAATPADARAALSGLLHAAGVRGADREACRLTVLTADAEDVTGAEPLCAAQALLHGAGKVIVQEYEHIQCRVVDLSMVDEPGAVELAASQVSGELAAGDSEQVVAYRGRHRWIKAYEPARLPQADEPRLRKRGVYLITGGLGGIGWHLAEHLATHWQADLVLIGRSLDAGRERLIDGLRARGVRVLAYAADVADAGAVAEAMQGARREFGQLNGIIHAAGVAHSRFIGQIRQEDMELALAAKVQGTENLFRAIGDDVPDFVLLFSSLASVLGGLGKSLYAAANAYLDAAAHAAARRMAGSRIVSVNWDGWRDIGMAAQMQLPDHLGIHPGQGAALFEAVLRGASEAQVLVSTMPLQDRGRIGKEVLQGMQADAAAPGNASQRHPRPSLSVEYLAPEGDLEESLAEIWAELLGIEGLGAEDSLFELGGDSLLAIQLLARVKGKYGVEIPPAGFFQDPTIAALAILVESELIEQIEQDGLAD